MAFDILALPPREQIAAVYVAYFGRAPDPEGLSFWLGEYESGLDAGKTPKQLLSDIADSFSKQAETFSLFPFFADPSGADPGEFVDAVFQNLFARAPDSAGRQFWIDEIELRLVDGRGVGTAIVDIVSGAQDTSLGNDALTIGNRIAAADFYATEYLGKGAVWTVDDDIAGARQVIASVDDSSASLDASKELTSAIVAADLSGANLIVLTPELETVIGTDGPDVFFAPLVKGALGQLVQTLQTNDFIKGGDGADVIEATIKQPTTTRPFTSDVEKVVATFVSDLATLDLLGSSGIAQIVVDGSTSSSKIQGIGDGDLAVRNVAGDLNVLFGYRALGPGEAASPTLTLDMVTLTDSAGDDRFGRIRFASEQEQTPIDTLTIAVSGPTTIDGIDDDANFDGVAQTTETALDGLQSIFIVASAAAALGDLPVGDTVTLVDASASTAGVSARLAASGAITLKGGSGDDVVDRGGAIQFGDDIDLGSGNDTLIISGGVDSTSFKASNIETVEINTASNSDTLNAENFDGVKNFSIVSTDDSHKLTLDSLSNSSSVKITDAAGPANRIAEVTLNGANTFGGLDVINVSVSHTDADQGFSVERLDLPGFETVAIESHGPSGSAAKNVIEVINAAAATTMTLSGDSSLSVGNVVNGKLTAPLIDGSQMTADLELAPALSGAFGGKQTVIGGPGDDVFDVNIDDLASTSTIDGGAGIDSLALTQSAAGDLDLTGAAGAALLGGLKNVEGVRSAGRTILIDDATLKNFSDASLTVVESGNQASGLDASKVQSSLASVSVDASGMSAGGFTFVLGNGADSYVGSDAAKDTIKVTNAGFISDQDVIAAGFGVNVFDFDTNQGAGAAQTVFFSQLANVTGFDTLNINDTEAAANPFNLTVSDAFAEANANATTNTLTITAAGNANDTISVDASNVTATVSVKIIGGSKADTLVLGQGDDSVTGAAGNDTLTLGPGSDKVVFGSLAGSGSAVTGANDNLGIDTLLDFDFGSADTSGFVDRFDASTFAAAAIFSDGTFDNVVRAAGGFTNSEDLLILDQQAFADIAAARAAWTASTNGGPAFVLWQEALGPVHISYDNSLANDGVIGVNEIDLAVIPNASIVALAAVIDPSDFILG